jgi:trehalose-6-phosphate synthase
MPWPPGIELKLQAYELLLSQHPEMAEQMVLVQVCNPARSAGRDIQELQAEVGSIVVRRCRLKSADPPRVESALAS